MKAFLITLLLLCSPTVDAKKKGSKKKKEPPKLEGDHASAALHLAAKKGHTKAVREILDAGVDPNAVWKGTTAMALAAGAGHEDCVAILLGANADVNKGNPLAHAASTGHFSALRWLLSANGIKVDQRTTHAIGEAPAGATALHIAVGRGYLQEVEVLLKSGADPRLRDGKGEDVMHVARRAAARSIVEPAFLNECIEKGGGDFKSVVATIDRALGGSGQHFVPNIPKAKAEKVEL